MMSAEEEQGMLSVGRGMERLYDNDTSVLALFGWQAVQWPQRVALISGTEQWTYGELWERSLVLGRYLVMQGVGRDTRVGLCLERSREMVLGILGIWQAGGAYVPIDPGYPTERIEYLLQDTGSPLVLSRQAEGLAGRLEGRWRVVELDRDWEEILQAAGESDDTSPVANGIPATPIEADQLAYVIYTSGSTGQPKGVGIEQGALWNRLCWMQERYQLNEQDVLLQKTPFTFDVSVWELCWWILGGSRLVMLAPGEEKEPEAVISTVECEGVSILHFVPPMLGALLETVETKKSMAQLKSLRRIFTSGEALPPSIVRRYRELGVHAGLTNLYGPTEATIDVSYYDLDNRPEAEWERSVPIGRAVSNTGLYVLDGYGRLVP